MAVASAVRCAFVLVQGVSQRRPGWIPATNISQRPAWQYSSMSLPGTRQLHFVTLASLRTVMMVPALY